MSEEKAVMRVSPLNNVLFSCIFDSEERRWTCSHRKAQG